MIRADPTKNRQLSLLAPDILWRGGQTGRSGLVLDASACANPECPCQEVELRVFRVGDWLAGIEIKQGRFAFCRDARSPGQMDPPGEMVPVLQADLNLDTGALCTTEGAAPEMRDESVLAWLRDEMDGELLDHLADKTLRHKGLRSLARLEVAPFDPGDMICFGEAFLTGRVDSYLIEGRRLEVIDAYCVDPDCTCTEIRLLVDEAKQAVGSIAVDLAEPRWPCDVKGKPELEQAWAAFVRRYPGPQPFRKRAKLMKEAGHEIMASARQPPHVATPKVGRNQPCPCGSGKKYKRCCLGKVSVDV